MTELLKVKERHDYTHLNGVLKERVSEICALVAKKMVELELDHIAINDKYSLNMVTHRDYTTFLVLEDADKERDAFVSDTACTWDGYPRYNTEFCDFYADYHLDELTTKQRLLLLNSTKAIADALCKSEDEKCAILNAALGIK